MKKNLYMLLLIVMIVCCACSNDSEQKKLYQAAVEMMDEGEYQEAYNQFKALGEYEDAFDKAEKCYIGLIDQVMEEGDYDRALSLLEESGDMDIPDKDLLITRCKCKQILIQINNGDFDKARTLIADIGENEVSGELEKECNYAQGVSLFEQKKYAEAGEYLLKTEHFEETDYYLLKTAQKLVKQKKYQKALNICKTLGNNNKIKSLVADIYTGMKYERYKKGVEQGVMLLGETQYLTAKETETLLETEIYGKWVEFDTGESLQIDKYERDGKLYGIYTATQDSSYYTIYYYYMDEPEKIYVDWLHEMNVPGYETQMVLESFEQAGYEYEEYCYLRKSVEEIRETAKLPGYESDDFGETNSAESENDNTSNNSTSNSNRSNNVDNDELIALANANLGNAIADTAYGRNISEWEMKSCKGVSTTAVGDYDVTFEVFFLDTNSNKNVHVILTKSIMGEYRYFAGKIY